MRPELTRTMSHRGDALRVVMWTKPGCAACARTEKLLTRHDVPVLEENMTAEILQFAADMGFREAPVVLGVRPDGTSTWWAGLDFGKIAEFVGLARKAAENV